MPSPSLHHGLQTCSDLLKTNPDDILKPHVHKRLQPSWLSIDNQNSEENSGNSHGINSLNFVKPTTNSILDMCTETLGCETGAMCSVYELEIASVKKQKKKKKKKKDKYEFPPPLTTLHGEGRLRLRRKREEGRLLLTPYKPSVLESERSNGRLLLWLLPGREIGEEKEEKDEDGVEEKGCFVNGGGGKQRKSGRCKEGDIFNYDSLWVASS